MTPRISSRSWRRKGCWYRMQTDMPAIRLYAQVAWELLRYDLLFRCRGLEGVRPREAARPGTADADRQRQICQALRSIAPFYWKPIRCLQRAIVTARIMRRHKIPAEVVIGFRAAPFFSHAWVEVEGRVANDSPAYQARLLVLERF